MGEKKEMGEEKEPAIDLKALDEAILKVLAYKPKPPPKPESTSGK